MSELDDVVMVGICDLASDWNSAGSWYAHGAADDRLLG